MEAWQGRVVKEKQELDKKLVLLEEFLSSDNIPKHGLDLLSQQRLVMREYSIILGERIKNF